MKHQSPFSIVYQITQACPFSCSFCNSRFEPEEQELTPSQRQQMVMLLKAKDIFNLTVTGGEPMLLGEHLFDFLHFVHNQNIHVCLSTTGYKIDKQLITSMDDYIGKILLSVNNSSVDTIASDLGGNECAKKLGDTVFAIAEWIKYTGIILEVSTVIHKENIDNIIEIGQRLFCINPNIVWRIEDYYPMKKTRATDRHMITSNESLKVRKEIAGFFHGKFRAIYFSKRNRKYAPDFLITPGGNLVYTSYNAYSLPKYNIFDTDLPEFKMRRNLEEFKLYCRK